MNIDLRKIKQLSDELKSLQPLTDKQRHELDKKFRLEFNYNSNHLEGNTLTYDETKLLLVFDDTKGDHSLREYEEMKGSDVAYQLIQEWATDKERELSEQYIRSLNQILLVRPFWKDAKTPSGEPTRREIKVGEYKEHPNSVQLQNGELFEYASPADTPILMNELIQWYRDETQKNELHPVILAALLHYKFVCIHPFDDGNGRISRLIMNYVLFKNDLPPIVIKSEDKKHYLSALNRADSGDLEAFVKYIADQLIWSLELSIKAAKNESIDELGDLDKKIKQLKQKLKYKNDNIQVTKSPESVKNAFNHSILILIEHLSKKLSSFDVLYKSKMEYFFFNDKPLGNDLRQSTEAVLGKMEAVNFNGVSYKYFLHLLRDYSKHHNTDVVLDITFFSHVYEIKWFHGQGSVNKLYTELLSKEEVESIVESIGNEVLKEVERLIAR